MNSSCVSRSRCSVVLHTRLTTVSISPMMATTTSRPMYVKPHSRLARPCIRSPTCNRRAVGGKVSGAAVDIADAGVIRILRCDQRPGVGKLRERIDRDCPHVALVGQVGQLFGILVEVGVVLVDRLAQDRQILLQ